MKGTVKYTSD